MVLYIVKRSAHDVGSTTHLQALKDIYGDVFVVDLLNKEIVAESNYRSFGLDMKNFKERIRRYLQGNISFISDDIIVKICDIIKKNNINLIFTEESDLGKLYKKVKELFPKVKIICFFHDISADLFRQRIKDTKIWKVHYILECKRVIAQEEMAQRYMDERWVFHTEDAARFEKYYGYPPDKMVPIAAFAHEKRTQPAEIRSGCKQLLFVCSSYYVNIRGFLWFYINVVPKLSGDYEIVIAGDGFSLLKEQVQDSRIKLLGRVDSMETYYRNADIVIEPVFDGGGMKVKTIEALSFGKCIVSTTESLNGYWEAIPSELRDTLIFRCNSADEWIRTCNQLLKKEEIKKYYDEVYAVFTEHFEYTVLKQNFMKALERQNLRI